MSEPRRTSDRGNDAALRLRGLLLRGSIDDAGPILAEASGLEAEIRPHAVAGMDDLAPRLRRWVDERPEDPAIHLLAAIQRLDDIPWLSSQLEERRSLEQQHYDEIESLWRAVGHLQVTLSHRPDDVAARVWMAATLGGLSWRGAAPVEDFEVCAKIAENLLPTSVHTTRWRVHVADVVADADPVELASAWAGEWPDADPRHAEVLTAHIAKYRELLDDPNGAAEYWHRDDVFDSIVTATQRLGVPTGPAAHDAASVMAFVLPRTREPNRALPYFELLDGRVLTWPFAMLRQPLAAYSELLEWARRRTLKNLLRRR